ncbi:MAG: VOC family protein [Sphingomonadaceae bacterium]
MTLPVRQIAYFVADIRAAALAHHKTYGSGPFFILDHIPLVRSEHRGVSRPLDHSSAYGQWGQVMIEFVQQNNADPSAYHDLYPQGSGRFGLHHLAIFVDNLEQAIADYDKAGIPLAQYAETTTGTGFAFVDATATLGHMIELYEPSDGLVGFYAHVAGAAAGWDGQDPLRTLNSG